MPTVQMVELIDRRFLRQELRGYQRKRTLMRLIQRLSFLFVSTALLISVYAQDVHYNCDRSANFAGYQTYQWDSVAIA